MDLPVSILEAIQGQKVDVPTLHGTVTLQIPAGTDGGTRLRLRGKGISASNGKQAGDLYVTVKIRVPKNLSEEQILELKEMTSDDPEAWRDEAFSR